VLCGLTFENVTAVRSKQIDMRKREDILALLTIHSEPGAVMLLFAGGGSSSWKSDELRRFCRISANPGPPGAGRGTEDTGPANGPALQNPAVSVLCRGLAIPAGRTVRRVPWRKRDPV
jgi:hypothetical protein